MGTLWMVVMLALSVAPLDARQTPTQANPAPTAGTGEVRGRIMSGVPPAPVAGASVKLTGGGLIKTSAADEGGRFVFKNLPPGQYTISVSSNGTAVTAFGGSTPRAAMINLAEGARVDRGDLVLPSGVAITGQILDEHGNPLKGATVSAWRAMYIIPGQRRLEFSGQALSDDFGDYRIAGVKPGTYLVDAKAGESTAPTFFPATTDAWMAGAVRVSADVGAAAISIRLLPTRLARVSGSILNAQGQPSSDFVVFLSPVGKDFEQVSLLNLVVEADAAGRFVIEKVPPGNYSVEVIAKARMEAIGKTGRSAEGMDTTESGSTPVTVDGADVGDLVVRTSMPTSLSGKVTIDGVSISAEMASRLEVSITVNSNSTGMLGGMKATSVALHPDGTFAVPVIPGGRLIRVFGLPAGTTLARVMVNGIDVMDEGFDVGSADMRDIVVALTSKPTGVTGRITDDRAQPQAAVGVIVFSDDAKDWSRLFTRRVTSARTKADGTFTVSDLPPGNYYAAVVPTLVDGEWAEPSNLEKLRATATSFKLSDGEQKTLMLTLRRLP